MLSAWLRSLLLLVGPLACIIHEGGGFRPAAGQTGRCHHHMGSVMSDLTAKRSSRWAGIARDILDMSNIAYLSELQTRQCLDRMQVDRGEPGGWVS
jgi:hypothetical protein